MDRINMKTAFGFYSVLVACMLGFFGSVGEAKAQFTNCSAITGMPQIECEALVALYDSTNGANWTTKTGWKQTTTPCSWYGVICIGGRVDGIWLQGNKLSGSIPESIGNLSNMRYLALYNNQLSGSIPESIGNLSKLLAIYIWSNHLSGNIPESIGNLSELFNLRLDNNQLSGSIPESISNLSNLQFIILNNNQLSGSIPESIGNLSNLTDLYLFHNRLSGSIPESIGNLSKLLKLDLNYNQLSGGIPASIGNLSNLTNLYLFHNQLSGSIPESIGNLSILQDLYLYDNHLSGNIPESIGNLSVLFNLRLYNNQLSGSIPESIGNLSILQDLYLYNNQLSGGIPASIGNLSSLQYLYLYNNRLSGSIPESIGNLSILQDLYLYNNQLSGSIPESIGNLSNLCRLHLFNNHLSGTFPQNISSLSNLGELLVQDNELSGELPQALLDKGLVAFDWYHNHFLISVSGKATDPNSTGISGVTISVSGQYETSTLTDKDGNYLVKIPDGYSYTITPSKAGYAFQAEERTGLMDASTIGGLLLTGQDFTADTSRHTLSGTATAGGSPLSGVMVTGSGSLGSQTTDASGHYRFSGVLYGTSYTLTPSKMGYAFNPTSVGGTVTGDATQDLAATLNDSDGDSLSDLDEASRGTNPNNPDSDGDGIHDGQEVMDGTNPTDLGSRQATRPTTLCAEWNGFLGMWNVLEHVNTGTRKISIESTLHDLFGADQTPVTFSLKSGYQYDLLVHGLTGFQANRYGLICSTATNGQPGDLDGRMVFYKPDAATGGYQFAFAMPLGTGLIGTQSVPYNTYQPSLDPADASNLAANWIQLTNLGASKQTGTLVFYDRDGVEITRQAVTLKAGARFDYAAHDLAGLKQVGIVEWRPASTTAKFQLRNVRYYYRADGVTVPLGEDFESAFQLEGLVGSGQVLTVPLDTANASSVLEIANTRNEEVKAEVSIYAATGGTALHHQTYKLKPHATYHLITDAILNGSQGLATVQGNKPGSVIATAMQYGRTETLSLQTVYGLQASEPMGTTMRGSYNTYLKQGCRLLMANPTSAEVITKVSMKRYDGTTVKLGEDFAVPANGLTDYDLCAQEQENVYGVVTVQPQTPNTIFATVLRIGENEQYRFPTPVRQ